VQLGRSIVLASGANQYSEGIIVEGDDDGRQKQDDQEQLSIEDSIAQELSAIQESKNAGLFIPVDLDCECVIFFRTRLPIDPVEIVKKICKDVKESKRKKSKYAQRLTPVALTAVATHDNLKALASKVLASQFHAAEGQTPVKFAIRPTIRNHNTLERDEIIKSVAEAVGHDHGHSVDLKNFDKMILVECFKVGSGKHCDTTVVSCCSTSGHLTRTLWECLWSTNSIS
jgi:tRNA acetyltransferase TAN1